MLLLVHEYLVNSYKQQRPWETEPVDHFKSLSRVAYIMTYVPLRNKELSYLIDIYEYLSDYYVLTDITLGCSLCPYVDNTEISVYLIC